MIYGEKCIKTYVIYIHKHQTTDFESQEKRFKTYVMQIHTRIKVLRFKTREMY